jgi:hypothetical protein
LFRFSFTREQHRLPRDLGGFEVKLRKLSKSGSLQLPAGQAIQTSGRGNASTQAFQLLTIGKLGGFVKRKL